MYWEWRTVFWMRETPKFYKRRKEYEQKKYFCFTPLFLFLRGDQNCCITGKVISQVFPSQNESRKNNKKTSEKQDILDNILKVLLNKEKQTLCVEAFSLWNAECCYVILYITFYLQKKKNSLQLTCLLVFPTFCMCVCVCLWLFHL